MEIYKEEKEQINASLIHDKLMQRFIMQACFYLCLLQDKFRQKCSMQGDFLLQDKLMQRYIMQAHLWDPAMDKLPKRFNTQLPGWHFKREHGVRVERTMYVEL